MNDNAATLEEVETKLGPRSAHAFAFAWLDALGKGTAKARRLAAPGFDIRGTRAQLHESGFDQHAWGLLRGNASARPGEVCVVFLRADYRDVYKRRGLERVPAGGVISVTVRRHGPPHARRWLVSAIGTNAPSSS